MDRRYLPRALECTSAANEIIRICRDPRWYMDVITRVKKSSAFATFDFVVASSIIDSPSEEQAETPGL